MTIAIRISTATLSALPAAVATVMERERAQPMLLLSLHAPLSLVAVAVEAAAEGAPVALRPRRLRCSATCGAQTQLT